MNRSLSGTSEIEAGGSPSSPVTELRSSDGCRCCARKARSRRWRHRLSPRTNGSSRSSMPTCDQSAAWPRGPWNRQGEVLVVACLSPLPPPSGLNSRPLADCVPSMPRWKLATLPTYLPAAQVQKALDGRDRETVMGRRDFAILLLLAKVGLRADEVATLTLDDRLARQRDARSHQGPTACTNADTARHWRGYRCISAQWPPKVVVPTVVRPHTGATRRLCFRMRDHHDRQGRP